MTPGAKKSSALFAALGITQIIYYSALYYLFPALLPYIPAGTSWSALEYSAGITLLLLASGIAALFNGALVDKNHGFFLMGFAGILGGLSLIAMPHVPGIYLFYLCMALCGYALAMGTYEVCFSSLTRRYGTDASRPIVLITVIGGFASTITFPLARLAAVRIGVSGAFSIFGVIGVITGLSMLAAAFRLQGSGAQRNVEASDDRRYLSGPGERTALLYLVAARAFLMCTVASLHNQLLPLFQNMRFTLTEATWLAACFGPLQVTGRIIYTGITARKRVSPFRAAMVFHCLFVLAAAILYLARLLPPLVFVFIALQAVSIGTMSILNPQVAFGIFGRAHVGKAGGAIAFVGQLAASAAPVLSAAFIARSGIAGLPLVYIGTTFLSCYCFFRAARYAS